MRYSHCDTPVFSYLFSTGGGSSRYAENVLPHVTPSPRVPATDDLLTRTIFCTHTQVSHPEGSGPRPNMAKRSASRHSFPKSTCKP